MARKGQLKDCPCSPDCKKRSSTCHSSCKEYRDWNDDRERYRNDLHAEKQSQYAADGHMFDTMIRNHKQQRISKKKVI